MKKISTIEAYVFYFDILGFVDNYTSERQKALDRLRAFQRAARATFEFSQPSSFTVTLYDNVWSRINISQPGTPSLVLDYAGKVMQAAIDHGFPHFFGSITRGQHDFDPNDRMLVAKENWEDLTEQHIDITSEPHIRAAHAERWKRYFPLVGDTVWVSSEVLEKNSLPELSGFPDSAFEPFGTWFDLATDTQADKKWPFLESRFHAIRPK